jgi:phosphopantothenoylcysteine synthetase/decarboxylase
VMLVGQRGVGWVGPAEGRLACGVEGPGRMAPVVEIVEAIDKVVRKKVKTK